MPVRVIAKAGKKWLLDPQPSIAPLWDMLWLYARQPVSRLMWEPGGMVLVKYECVMAVFTLSLWTTQVRAMYVNNIT